MAWLFRMQLGYFLGGAALAGAYATYALRQDLASSHGRLVEQVQAHAGRLEARVAALEAAGGEKS
jgi:hypothetical protein